MKLISSRPEDTKYIILSQHREFSLVVSVFSISSQLTLYSPCLFAIHFSQASRDSHFIRGRMSGRGGCMGVQHGQGKTGDLERGGLIGGLEGGGGGRKVVYGV